MTRLLINRWVHFTLLLVLVLAAVFYSGSDTRWRQEMQFLVFDTLNELYPREKSDEVIIVDIDDDSLQKIGQWPWPRTDIAKLVGNLTKLGAKVVAFDGVLAEPDRSSPRFVADSLPDDERFSSLRNEVLQLPDHDTVLAQAIADSGLFVSAFTFATYTQSPRKPRLIKPILASSSHKKTFLRHSKPFRKAATFLPELESAAAGNGSFMAYPESDGVMRRTSLFFSDGMELYPSLGLETLRVAQKRSVLSAKVGRNPNKDVSEIDTAYRLVIGDYVVPIEEDGLVWVYYRRFDERGDDYLSAYKIIDKKHHQEIANRIQDKIVFIGSSAEGLKDLRSTALEAFQPGVEIHANVVEQVLQGKFLIRPEAASVLEASFILVVGGLMVLLAPFINVILLAGLCLGLIAMAFIGAGVAYVDYGVLLDPFYPSLSVFSVFVVSTILTYLRVESEKQQVRSAFGLYISPEFMQELTKDPDKLKLGGEIRDLSVMFTDIRNFTSISEGLMPEELIQLMNDFLTPMSDLVMQNRGTIDKYMGDAMMAFWNAPLDDPDHERHACITALRMQAALEPINKSVKAKAQELGKEPVLLNAGIGINTGPCAVGNMGSRQRFAYSTLGDSVNLASRLEGQTKTYGVNILIGESTYEKVGDMAALEMDLIKVKGKTKPVRVFALLGDEEMAATGVFKDWKGKHDQMLKVYRDADFKSVQKLIKECRAASSVDLNAAYILYEERTKSLLKDPPGDSWDGVYEALTK